MVSEWTVDTLKAYVEAELRAVRAAVETANNVSEQRATKIEVETKAKFEGTNQWRQTVTDAQSRFVPRTEFEAAKKGLEEKIQAKNIQIFLSLGVGFVAVVIAVFNFASGLGG